MLNEVPPRFLRRVVHRVWIAVGHVGDLGMSVDTKMTNMITDALTDAFARGEQSGAEKERAAVVCYFRGEADRFQRLGRNWDALNRDEAANAINRGDHLPKGPSDDKR